MFYFRTMMVSTPWYLRRSHITDIYSFMFHKTSHIVSPEVFIKNQWCQVINTILISFSDMPLFLLDLSEFLQFRALIAF